MPLGALVPTRGAGENGSRTSHSPKLRSRTDVLAPAVRSIREMTRLLWTTAGVFGALAAAAIVAAIFLPSSCGIEGAYFDRSIGAPSSVGSIVISRYGVCWVPDVLLGAAAAFALCAVVLAVIGTRLRRRAAT